MATGIDKCDIEIRVRYAEVDQMGVLHHSRYWVYFEMGRTELLRANGVAYRDCEQAGVFFVLSKCSARFLAPARYDDVLVLSTRITRMGLARIDHAYELRRKSDGALLATAETTLACVNRQGEVTPIPPGIRGGNRRDTGDAGDEGREGAGEETEGQAQAGRDERG